MSTPLPDDFRRSLGMEGEPNIEEGLTHAEERLKQVLEQLEKLPDKNPASGKLKHDREMLEPIIQELRDAVHGVKVDELCDEAEEALAEKPTRRAKARELLKQARREGKPLAADSDYLRRVQKLEAKLDHLPGEAEHAPARPGSSTGKDLGMDATIPLQKATGAPAPKSGGQATGGTPGKLQTGISPVSEDIGTGGAPSTIPTGLVAGYKIGAGRFTLIRELGRGGMGVVWLATDGLLKREVAVKLLPPEVANDDLALNDLRRETVESQRLSHPHIIRIHDLYQSPGEPAFISMEYVDGTNLRSLLGKQPERCFSWEFLRPLLAQLCSALDYAHSERVIHRDLKPSNLMLDSRGRLKLADFGIAATMSDSMSRVSQHSKDKDTSGTLNYMSPQQMRGDNPTGSDDIYSLGATLYELMTSRTPFYRGDIQYQVKHEIPQKPAERIASLNIKNEIPEPVSAMIMACLAKEPKERPQSATWIVEQLEGTKTSPTLTQAPMPTPPTVTRQSVDISEPRTADTLPIVTPPTVPPRSGNKPPPVEPEVPLTGRIKPLPVNVPTPSPKPEPKPAAGGGKTIGILVGVAGVVILAIIALFAFGHKSHNGPVIDAGNLPGTNIVTPAAASDIQITTVPSGADVFSNGVPVGKATAPMMFTGAPGDTVTFEARLEGYANLQKKLSFPASGQSQSEPLTLQALPALLFVSSDPPPSNIILMHDGRQQNVTPNPAGIPIDPGVSYDVTVMIPDRETVHTNISIAKAGGQLTLTLLQVPEQAATMQLKADPPHTRFSIIYPGKQPILFGTNTLITGIMPRTRFQLVAEHPGYYPQTNEFELKPNETRPWDFGRLRMMTADLQVNATPRGFNLIITYDGTEHAYGVSGRASGLPAGRNLIITAQSDSGSATTNATLDPGVLNTIYLGSLTSETGFLYVKSQPDGATVSYAVDTNPMNKVGRVDRLDNLPLGKTITITLRLAGYEPKTMVHRMVRSGDTVDFTRLTPLRNETVPQAPTPANPIRETPPARQYSGNASVKVYGPHDDAEIFIDGRPTGVKNDGVVSGLVAGRMYEIRLHRLGFEDVIQNVTMNSDGSEKYVLIDKKDIPATQVSGADLDAKLREIDAKKDDVGHHIPFGDVYRREMNDYIDKNERLYKRIPAVWTHIQLPLMELKKMVNDRNSFKRRGQ